MSNLQIYLARNNVQAGPYDLTQLNKMLASGEVELNDLMWHEGMENWQRVGVMTKETLRYTPFPTHSTAVNLTKTAPDSVATSGNRTSVDRLYGKKPQTPSTTPTKVDASKRNLKKEAIDAMAPKKIGTNQLADIGPRILATLIDFTLAIASLVPFFAALDFSFDALMATNGDYDLMRVYMESLPQHLLLMSNIMILALLVVQTTMLLNRGQSIGKLATGVRILDINTHAIPSATNLILLRTILTGLAYSLGFIGIIIAATDLTVMLFDNQRRSLHDKLSKTYVAKAHDRQLTSKQKPKNKKPDSK